MLPDGTYDAFVVDVEIEEPADGGDRIVRLELTLLTGEHKGEVVTVTATNLSGSEFDLIGMPATLTVADGSPTVTID